jgi:predicted Zn-dependent protease
MGGQSTIKVKRAGIAAALAVLLAGCTSSPATAFVSLPMSKPPRRTPREPAAQRENARILASYGGTCDNARLQAMIEKTVDRPVAASERPAGSSNSR